jgi:hypothetical protein
MRSVQISLVCLFIRYNHQTDKQLWKSHGCQCHFFNTNLKKRITVTFFKDAGLNLKRRMLLRIQSSMFLLEILGMKS